MAPAPLDARAQPPPPVLVDRGARRPAPAKRSKLKTLAAVSLIAGGVLAAAGTYYLLQSRSTYDDGKNAGCTVTITVDCNTKANTVASDNQRSQVLYTAAGIAGAAGVVLFLIPTPSPTPSPARSPTPTVGLSATLRF
jgi:hypothetical protein